MNKKELIEALYSANKDDLGSKAAAARIVDSVLEIVKSSVKKGDGINVVGFGTLSVKKQSARKGRNPQTGDIVKIPAKNVIRFKAGKALKDAASKAKIKK